MLCMEFPPELPGLDPHFRVKMLLAERDQVVRNLCIEIMFEKCSPFEGRGAEERKKKSQ